MRQLVRDTTNRDDALLDIPAEAWARFTATAHLKRVWGDRCQLLYVDAPLAVRASEVRRPQPGCGSATGSSASEVAVCRAPRAWIQDS